jgi:hypothetical protein
MEIRADTRVGDLEVGQLRGLLETVFREAQTSIGSMLTKDTKLSTLSVDQFTQLMVSVNETKSYLAAQKEQQVTERIFKDADGLIQAGVVPFRAETAKDLEEFTQTIKQYFVQGGKGVFVIAAALLVDGTYRGTR